MTKLTFMDKKNKTILEIEIEDKEFDKILSTKMKIGKEDNPSFVQIRYLRCFEETDFIRGKYLLETIWNACRQIDNVKHKIFNYPNNVYRLHIY